MWGWWSPNRYLVSFEQRPDWVQCGFQRGGEVRAGRGAPVQVSTRSPIPARPDMVSGLAPLATACAEGGPHSTSDSVGISCFCTRWGRALASQNPIPHRNLSESGPSPPARLQLVWPPVRKLPAQV